MNFMKKTSGALTGLGFGRSRCLELHFAPLDRSGVDRSAALRRLSEQFFLQRYINKIPLMHLRRLADDPVLGYSFLDMRL